MIKKNYKLIVGIIIGVIISAGTSYVVAATVINSRDVSYTDNSKLGVTNVQAAIDGTCSKISNISSSVTDLENSLSSYELLGTTTWQGIKFTVYRVGHVVTVTAYTIKVTEKVAVATTKSLIHIDSKYAPKERVCQNIVFSNQAIMNLCMVDSGSLSIAWVYQEIPVGAQVGGTLTYSI